MKEAKLLGGDLFLTLYHPPISDLPIITRYLIDTSSNDFIRFSQFILFSDITPTLHSLSSFLKREPINLAHIE